MQEIFSSPGYRVVMTTKNGHLRFLREKAGLTLRELSRQLGEHPSNMSYWERTGTVPRSGVLLPMAKALGVTVEELLGEPKSRRTAVPGGKAGQVLDALSRLPRRQQQKIIDVVEALVAQHSLVREA
jgi:transcriptional regulator with XRE-family HTH domain